ncbi:Phospholipase D, partial [Hondaea fermentalgiana]
ARPGLRAARPEEEPDGEQSRQSSTLGAVPLPEVPDFLRRDSMTAENFVIPEPEFTVTETLSKEQSAYGLGSGGEIVYKVWLKFGDMGEWDIFVTRTDLSSLISKLKLNSMLAFRPNLGHRLGRHRSVDRPGSNNMLQQQRRQSERRILIPQFSERGLRTASARPLPMTRSSSTPTPSPAAAASPGPPQPTPVGNSDMSDAGHPPGHRGSDASVPGEKHMLLKLTKLLFVPAVGTASRVRKVKAERRRIVQSIFQSILSNEVVRNVAFVKEFLCISTLTFDSRFGVSLKEGWVRVDVHGRERANEKLQWKGKISCCCCICACAPDPQRAKSCLQPRYRRNRWLWAVVKPSFVAFFDKSPNEIDARAADFVLLYSRGYEINKSYSTTGSHRRIMLVGDSLTVRIKFPVRWQKKVWGKAMRAAFEMTSIGTDAFSGDMASNPENALHAGWSDTHQNQSFAPRRYPHEEPGSEMCKAKFHIDGESYFRAVFEAIEAAESQVFIQGWMLPGNGNFDGDGGNSAPPELRPRHSGSDSSSSRNVGASHRNGGIANGSNVEDLEPGFVKGLNRTLDDVPEDRMSNATLMESDLEEEEDVIPDRNEDASETSQLDEDEEKEEPLPPPPLLANTVVMSHDDASSEDVGNGDVHGGDDWNRDNEPPEKPRADSSNHVFDVGAQAIRSLGLWSGSTPGDKERSIEKAMRNLIEDAERFIYIENQFFISGLDADNIVANRVLDTLFKRIVRAHQAKTPFKVIVVIPLLPGFDGYVQESASIRRVLYYEYRCINRGPNSLFQNLLHKGINPDEHIFFCGLRTWETLGGGAPSSSSKADEILGLRQLATELIYVHSKVLIVDDAKCIIGSGNINDRSLAGNRDTEFAVVIEASAKGSNFVRAFRLALMSEHWGVQDSPLDPLWEMLRSPWRDAHFARLVEIAQTNTKAFEDIFPCLPRNDVRDAADLRRYSDSRYVVVDSSNAIEHFLSTRVKGHIVEFPLHFLSQYELRPGIIEDGTGAILGDEVFI